MSGHSKWSTIKRKKQSNDAARSNIFSKMSRLIATAVQEGGGISDPEKNFKLRLAIDRAKSFNMPKDTIQRAVEKGSGADGAQMKEVVYEGFGPSGVPMLILAITDNSNRTFSEIRMILDKSGGKIAGQNAVSYMFTQCGIVELKKTDVDEQKVFEMFDELGGLDIEEEGESYIMYIPFDMIGKVEEILGGISPKSLDIHFLPQNPIEATPELLKKLEQIQEKLEDLEDVQSVYFNV